METLADYLATEGITYTAFAKAIERSVATVSRIARREQMPDPPTIEMIFKKSGGRVQPNSFYDLPKIRRKGNGKS